MSIHKGWTILFRLLVGSVAIYGGVGALRALVPFLMLPILTHQLTTGEFGILMIVETTVLFVSPFVLANLPGAVSTEYFHLSPTDLKDYLTNSLILALGAWILVTLVVFACTFAFPDFGGIPSIVWVCVPLFAALKLVGTVTLGIFQMRQEPHKFAMFVFMQVLIDLALSYLFVVIYNTGFVGRLAGIYGAFFVSTVLGIAVLRHMGLFSFKWIFHCSKKILTFTLPLIPHTLAGAVLAMSDRYFIAAFVGKDAVGAYGVAYQISSIIMLIAMSVNQAWNPILFRLLKTNTMEANRKAKMGVAALICLFVITGVGIYASSDYLFEWFIDKKYFEAKLFFPWLLIGFICQAVYMLFSSSFFYHKKTAHLATLTVIFAISNLLLNYVLIGQLGTLGGAYATAITWFATMICVAMYSVRLFNNSTGTIV